MSKLTDALKRNHEDENQEASQAESLVQITSEIKPTRGRASKFLGIFALIAFCFALICITAYYLISYENEKKTRQKVEQELTLTREEKKKIQENLSQIKKENLILEKKIDENKNTISGLNSKLAEEIKTKSTLMQQQQDLQASAKKAIGEKDAIKSILDNKLIELAAMQTQLEQVIAEKNVLEGSLSKASSKVAEAPVQGSESKEATGPQEPAENLEKIIVTPLAAVDIESESSKIGASMTAEVFLVNREYDFLILNIGKNEGVVVGEIFEVFHDGASIGNIQTEKIHDAMSAAKFLEGFRKDQVVEGDRVNRVD
ncbi:hypothetical protein ACFL96_13270 [Thermoproteota archaeon]